MRPLHDLPVGVSIAHTVENQRHTRWMTEALVADFVFDKGNIGLHNPLGQNELRLVETASHYAQGLWCAFGALKAPDP